MIKRRILSGMVLLSFVLGSCKGYIALWKDGQAEPVKVFPYKVSSLPASDREKLERGVKLDSMEELEQLIEDYLS